VNRTRRRRFCAWPLACATALAGVAGYPLISNELARSRQASRIAEVRERARSGRAAEPVLDPRLSLRVARLSGLLSSWESVGGCGAGSSTGAGGGIKWIGRSVTGGLFQLQTLGTYLHLKDGYNLSLTTQINRDLGEKWNAGLSVPLLYKYYRNYEGYIDPSGRLVDVSNSGLGDIGVFLTRRFGEINDTSLTLQIGLPTGTYDAAYRTIRLTQEKQLGAGKISGSLTLDHTFDETWGLIVAGTSFGWRGGQNSVGNYRAPVGSIYGYAGYFMGPFVPSFGLGLTRFFAADREGSQDQLMQLMAVTGTISIEWSSDVLAILAGFSLPYGWEERGSAEGGGANNNLPPGLQPWTVGVGVTVSPF